jgi:hypothetical protein
MVVFGSPPASAHTPAVDVSCEQLTVRLASYQAGAEPNTVRVVVDGAELANTPFGAAYDRTFTFTDAAVAHDWSVAVTAFDDPSGANGWTFTRSGTTSPCAPPDACPELSGDQPPGTSCTQPGDEIEGRVIDGAPDCTTGTVTSITQTRTRSYTWDGTSWVPEPWSPWTTTRTDVVPVPPGTCDSTEVTAVAPTYTPPSCTTAPALDHPAGTGYRWELSGTPEAQILTAVAEDGYTLVGQTTFGPYDTTPWTDAEKEAHGCGVTPPEPTIVTPAVSLTTPECLPGNTPPAGPALTVSDQEGLTYTVRDATGTLVSPDEYGALAAGTYTVTATAADGYEVADANGFVDGTRTLEVVSEASGCEAVTAPVKPRVRVIDECGTADDRVIFDRDNQYWTARQTGRSHVTFVAKGDTLLVDRDGSASRRVVLSFTPPSTRPCPTTVTTHPPGVNRPPVNIGGPPSATPALPNAGGPNALLGLLAALLLATGGALVYRGWKVD